MAKAGAMAVAIHSIPLRAHCVPHIFTAEDDPTFLMIGHSLKRQMTGFGDF